MINFFKPNKGKIILTLVIIAILGLSPIHLFGNLMSGLLYLFLTYILSAVIINYFTIWKYFFRPSFYKIIISLLLMIPGCWILTQMATGACANMGGWGFDMHCATYMFFVYLLAPALAISYFVACIISKIFIKNK